MVLWSGFGQQPGPPPPVLLQPIPLQLGTLGFHSLWRSDGDDGDGQGGRFWVGDLGVTRGSKNSLRNASNSTETGPKSEEIPWIDHLCDPLDAYGIPCAA